MESRLPTIAVVIPAYNREASIRYCLESVLRQTLSPCEIIVVDDCSTDNTRDLVNSFSDPRIRCLVQDRNSGAQAARNRGIHDASSDWIAFLDSDDEWIPDKLEKQIAVLETVNFDPMTVVHTDCYRYDYATGEKSYCPLPPVDGSSAYRSLLRFHGPMFQGMLTSRAAFQRIGFLDESVPSYQEWDTAIRLAKECRFIHIREGLFIYHLHTGETISKNRKNDMCGYQFIVDKHRNAILELGGNKTWNYHLIANARKAMAWGYSDDASEILAKMIGRSATIVLLEWMIRGKMDLTLYDNGTVVTRMMHFIRAYADKFFKDGIRSLFESRPLTRNGD